MFHKYQYHILISTALEQCSWSCSSLKVKSVPTHPIPEIALSVLKCSLRSQSVYSCSNQSTRPHSTNSSLQSTCPPQSTRGQFSVKVTKSNNICLLSLLCVVRSSVFSWAYRQSPTSCPQSFFPTTPAPAAKDLSGPSRLSSPSLCSRFSPTWRTPLASTAASGASPPSSFSSFLLSSSVCQKQRTSI